MIGGMAAFFGLFAANGLLEGAVAFALAPAGRRVEIAWYALMMNAVTLPIAWFVLMDPDVSWLLIELAVFAVEALLYRWLARVSVGRAVAISLAANAASLAAAVALTAYWTSEFR